VVGIKGLEPVLEALIVPNHPSATIGPHLMETSPSAGETTSDTAVSQDAEELHDGFTTGPPEVLWRIMQELFRGPGRQAESFVMDESTVVDSREWLHQESLHHLYEKPLLSDRRLLDSTSLEEKAPDGEYADVLADETPALIAVTDTCLYVMDPDFAVTAKPSGERPKPRLWARHSLRSLERVVIGYRGQTLRLEFSVTEIATPLASDVAPTHHRSGHMAVYGYTLLTRDKKSTFDLLQTVRGLANEHRTLSVGKVRIEHREEETLYGMYDLQIRFYQLLFQWEKGGSPQPRTLLVTDDRLLVSVEDFRFRVPGRTTSSASRPHPGERMTFLLNLHLRHVTEVCEGDDPRYLSITVREPRFGISRDQTGRFFF
jgi:hypothetical protein